MPFWLCDTREAQESRPMMRFDPRYWTVNFPRPSMASVASTGAESLRVDCTFYHSDELCGLIWESKDRFSHPLLAYATNRDYRRLTLKFRWRSGGILPLDAVNGPVLTIIGRDANGTPKSWYVRLWNYAVGTSTDAVITLPFSQLSGGYLLPQEADPVFAGDIDQMFISLVPLGFDYAQTAFPEAVEGWVELNEIRCDGVGVMLETGDVFLPEHDLKMATGYDDSYNLTPARLIEQIHALGYRGVINHYVGMSHYFRLEPLGTGHYVSLGGDAINLPCRAWHLNFANQAKLYGFNLIFSLSYELFDAHCWNDWKQRAENGDPALTGWVPPSTLLSPAHDGAMGYLQAVACAFVYIQKLTDLPVKFQIGEPWWWILPDKRICLYDAAATAKLGVYSVSIPIINGTKTAAQNAMLDKAGELLAASTSGIFAAVKNEALPHLAQTHLLTYLPTILDADVPEAKRANVPLGWAKPAFDILQLEDYDWVTSGNHGATLAGTTLMASRLGYPVNEQHYFAGFVLNAADSQQWRDIVHAADAAKTRHVSSRFIWAMPQVARDGFTYFDIPTDGGTEMQAFHEVLFPIEIGAEAEVSTEFSTNIITAVSGHEFRNSNWSDARLSYDVSPGIRSQAELETLIRFFRARHGPAIGFRFTDPLDYSSGNSGASPTPLDQHIGVGDGVRTEFPLVKNYGALPDIQMRKISHPRAGSVIVAVDGTVQSNWTLSEGGRVIFTTAPVNGAHISAGYEFDVPVRFADDRLDTAFATFGAGKFAQVTLVEIKAAI